MEWSAEASFEFHLKDRRPGNACHLGSRHAAGQPSQKIITSAKPSVDEGARIR
jgi:hypothetical protein